MAGGSATTTGLIGEFITMAAILEQEGWQVGHAAQDAVDVIAWHKDTFMRVQVKSSHLRQQSDKRRPNYHFQNGSGRMSKHLPSSERMDIIAHCAVDQRKVHFQAACCVNQYSQRRAPSFFDKPLLEYESWQKAVEIVMETRNG